MASVSWVSWNILRDWNHENGPETRPVSRSRISAAGTLVYTIWYTAFTYKYVSNYSFQGQMVRVYPSGMRIDSSNFNPVSVWSCGIQMVAMNYQTVTDTNLHLHNSLFNGTQGYILKVKVSLI